MNVKIKQQILKLIKAKEEFKKNSKKMKRMTDNSENYIKDTIRIFNENNSTTEIVEDFKKTETILKEKCIVKKFCNNSYIVMFMCDAYPYQHYEFENYIYLYSGTKTKQYKNRLEKLKILEVNHIDDEDNFYKNMIIKADYDNSLIISHNDINKQCSYISMITDEKMILEILSITTKMLEIYSDAQLEFIEILVKLREEKYREILNAVWE